MVEAVQLVVMRLEDDGRRGGLNSVPAKCTELPCTPVIHLENSSKRCGCLSPELEAPKCLPSIRV